jgi:hypothetical protein
MLLKYISKIKVALAFALGPLLLVGCVSQTDIRAGGELSFARIQSLDESMADWVGLDASVAFRSGNVVGFYSRENCQNSREIVSISNATGWVLNCFDGGEDQNFLAVRLRNFTNTYNFLRPAYRTAFGRELEDCAVAVSFRQNEAANEAMYRVYRSDSLRWGAVHVEARGRTLLMAFYAGCDDVEAISAYTMNLLNLDYEKIERASDRRDIRDIWP